MRKKILGLTVLAMFLVMLMPSALGATVECDSCASCQSAIDGAGSGDIIKLNTTITNQVSSCLASNTSTYTGGGILTDNITFDCQGYVIDGDGAYSFPEGGIYVEANNVTVKNCPIQQFVYNFMVRGTYNSTFENITTSSGLETATYDRYPFTLPSQSASTGCQYCNWIDVSIDNGATFRSASNNHWDGGSYSNSGNPNFNIQASSYGLVENVVLNGQTNLFNGGSFIFRNVTFKNSNSGTRGALWLASNNRHNVTVEDCLFENNINAIYSDDSGHLNWTIRNNNFSNNQYAIHLINYPDSGWEIYNNIFNNTVEDVRMTHASTPTISWNEPASLGLSIIGGPVLGGNNWYNYEVNQTDSDGDGLGDPFNITAFLSNVQGNQFDNYPLMSNYPVTCHNCSSCSSALQGASSGDVVLLNGSIKEDLSGTCVSFGSVSNITFNGAYSLGGMIVENNRSSPNGVGINMGSGIDNLVVDAYVYNFHSPQVAVGSNNTLRDSIIVTNYGFDIQYCASVNAYSHIQNIYCNQSAQAIEIYQYGLGHNLIENVTIDLSSVGFELYGSNYNVIRDSVVNGGGFMCLLGGSHNTYDNVTCTGGSNCLNVGTNNGYNNSFINGNLSYCGNAINNQGFNNRGYVIDNNSLHDNTNQVRFTQSGTNSTWYWMYNNFDDYDGWDTTGDGIGNSKVWNMSAEYPSLVLSDQPQVDSFPLTNNQDLYPPDVVITLPTNTSYITFDIDLNYTSTDNQSGVDSCWYSVNGSANTTISGCNNITIPLVDGFFHLEVYVNDSAGWLTREEVYFTIDSTAPSITIYAPVAQNYGVLPITLAVSANEIVDVWYYNINGTNVTFTPNTTLPITESGDYNLDVWVNDSVGFWGKSSVAFSFNPYFLANNPFYLIIPMVLALVALSLVVSSLVDNKKQLDLNRIIIAGVLMMITIVMLGVMFAVTI